MVGRIIGYIAAGILILFGVLFLWSIAYPGLALNQVLFRLVAGIVTVGIGIVIIWVVRTKGPRPIQQVVQQLDLDMPGEISVEKLKCESCGAELSKDNVTLAQGAVIISCPYCNSTYQITEEPKW